MNSTSYSSFSAEEYYAEQRKKARTLPASLFLFLISLFIIFSAMRIQGFFLSIFIMIALLFAIVYISVVKHGQITALRKDIDKFYRMRKKYIIPSSAKSVCDGTHALWIENENLHFAPARFSPQYPDTKKWLFLYKIFFFTRVMEI